MCSTSDNRSKFFFKKKKVGWCYLSLILEPENVSWGKGGILINQEFLGTEEELDFPSLQFLKPLVRGCTHGGERWVHGWDFPSQAQQYLGLGPVPGCRHLHGRVPCQLPKEEFRVFNSDGRKTPPGSQGMKSQCRMDRRGFVLPTGNSLTPSSKTTLKASGKIQRELPWVFVFIFVGLMLSCGYRSSGIDAEFAPNPQILNKQPFFKLAGPGEIPRENLSLLAEECLLALAGSDMKTPGFGVGGFPRPPRNGAGKNNGMKQNLSG